MNKIKVLVIDDEPQIRRLLQINLEVEGYSLKLVGTGKEGIMEAASFMPDLIILDIGLPDLSGHEVLKVLLEWYNKPILILSIENNESSIVNALDLGASDYIIKPFRVKELLARIRLAIRHSAVAEVKSILQFGDLEIELVNRIVKKAGITLKLTPKEYSIMALFAKNEGRVLTHQLILKEIWGKHFMDQTQYLRVFIAGLRKKIEDNPNNPIHIITESGIGYRFQ